MKNLEIVQISNEPAISLVKATIADLQFIKDLSFDEMNPIVSIAWKGGFRWKSWFKDIEKAINDGSQLIYVIQEAENNIGYLWMNVEARSLWITAIVLTRGWQRKHIGSMIIKRLKTEFSKVKISDKVAKIKLTETINLIDNITNSKVINENQILSLLRYHELLQELRRVSNV